VGVVAEDVFSGWGKDLGAVEAGGEVGGEEGPGAQRAEVLGAAGKGAGVTGG